MTSIIKFHGLSGVADESVPCYILQIDDFTFLLDCGWPGDPFEGVSNTYLREIQKYANKIDAVLLTHPDTYHLGALPYIMGHKVGISCPVYCTVPVYKMGQMFLYDFFISKFNKENFDIFNLDDVDFAFDQVVQLKYHQTVNLKGKGYGISICPLPAGHMIGGAIWKIVKGEEDIYYAMDYNHKKERHLNGCELERIQRPSLFITDAFNADYVQSRRRTRDEQLLSHIYRTVRNSGNVLITVDTAGRVLELATLLDQLWRNKESGLSTFSLIFLNNVAFNVMEFAKSQIEWMSDKLMRSFEGARTNPFQFKHMQICHTLAEVNKINVPKVVLTSFPDLETGYGRDLFMQWCSDPKNCVILTNRTVPGSLARNFIDDKSISKVMLEVKQRIKLEGNELDEFYRQQREDEYRLKKEKRGIILDSEEDSDSDNDEDIKVMGIYKGKHVNHDLFIKAGMETKVEPGIFRKSKSRYPLYPHFEEKIRFDEYGEFIKNEDFMINDVIFETDFPIKSYNKHAGSVPSVEILEVPTKCMQQTQTFNVNCSIHFIDFEGRSDGESIQKLFEQMKPRRMIITRGRAEAVKKLETSCSKIAEDFKVYAPSKTGEIVDVTTENYIYQIRLKDSLVSSLELSKGKDDAELAWIDGVLVDQEKIEWNGTAGGTENEEKMETEDLIPCLAHLPSRTSSHPAVFVNELKLSDFKQVLTKHGIPSEFSGGVLWCFSAATGGTVALRRQETNKLTIEGCICDEFYIIRNLLYQQYAIL